MTRTKIGIIGCGNVAGVYIEVCGGFDILQVAACSDIIPERAKSVAEQYGVPRACSTEELLADPEIGIVVNLTVPRVHAKIALQALEAGKSVFNEKPFALSRDEAGRILAAARDRGLGVGCAPDTFLGGGLQTCRKLMDDGVIGRPVAAAGFMLDHGPEGWHPNPEFFYKAGGGPLFDRAPYHLNALVTLLGPVSRVAGSAKISFPQRLITSRPKYGQVIEVEAPTHSAALLGFESGVTCTLTMSYEVWASRVPHIEVYGSKGTLSVPDPNTFGGPVRLCLAGESEWREVPLTHGYAEGNNRGIGVADLAYAMRDGRAPRAGGELAYHVVDVMQRVHEAAEARRYLQVDSRCERPAALPPGLTTGTWDE